MNFLALDTSSHACSVALQTGDDVYERHVVEPQAHTRILLTMVREILEQGECELQGLDGLILGNGPGSFIGLRIAASFAQGLSQGSGVALVPVSSLIAVAAEAAEETDLQRILVAQDARMNEVYLGDYSIGEDDVPELSGEILLQKVAAIAGLEAGGSCAAAGEGWRRYPDLLEANRANITIVSEIRFPRARFLLAAGRKAYLAGGQVDPAALVPAYVRQTVAQVPANR